MRLERFVRYPVIPTVTAKRYERANQDEVPQLMCPTLLLIESNEFVRLGVTTACETHPVRLLRSTDSIDDGIRLAGELHPDVIVVGHTSPRSDAQDRLQEIRDAAPDAKLLLWSDHSDNASYQTLLATGWSGWVQRALDINDFLFSVRSIADGRHLFIHDANQKHAKPHLNPRSDDESLPVATEALSAREREVLTKLAEGCTNKEIAEQIFLSIKTVETYRARLMKKLRLRSRSDLVRWVQSHDVSGYADAS